MLSDPNNFMWRVACGTHLTSIRLKQANAHATLGLLSLLTPIRRFIDRLTHE